MLTVGFFVGSNDPKNQEHIYSWTSFTKLQLNQLVEAENKLHLLQAYVAFVRSKAGSLLGGPPITLRDSEREKKAPEIERRLHSTVEEISSLGLFAWLDAGKLRQRKARMQTSLAKSLLNYVMYGTDNLKPMKGTQKEKGRSRCETMLRLIYEEFGLANALLVINSFSVTELESFLTLECVHLLSCFVRGWRYFFCGALEAEAAEILSSN